jgi:Flp pilus assembly protein TadD
MRCLMAVLFLMFVVLSSTLAGGCATHEVARTTVRLGDYQKLLEKQKAGMTVADEALKNLPEMSVQEYEMAGDNHFLQNNLPMAFVQYDKALQMAPTTLSLRYKKGLIFLKRGLAKDALQVFQEILKADDAFALADEGIGQACLMMGDMRKAEQYFQRAIALDASLWKSHNFLGMIYDRQKRFDEAITSYKAAMALKRDDGSLFNNFGVSSYRKGDYEKAIHAFDKALYMGYADAKVYNNLGLALAKLGRYQEALIAFTKGGDKAKAYNNLGVIYLVEGKYKEATAAFQEAMAFSPRYYTQASENLRLAQQALGTSPPSPEVLSIPVGESDAQAAR